LLTARPIHGAEFPFQLGKPGGGGGADLSKGFDVSMRSVTM